MATTTKQLSSDHVGCVGEVMRMPLTLFFKMDVSNDEYDRWLHKLHGEWGNIIVWWGAKELCRADYITEIRFVNKPTVQQINQGCKLVIRDIIDAEFHVKAHTFYEGEKQTLVVRLREWRPEEERKALKQLRSEQERQRLIDSHICPECKGRGRRRGKVCKDCEGGW